eukprot:gene186-377_t
MKAEMDTAQQSLQTDGALQAAQTELLGARGKLKALELKAEKLEGTISRREQRINQLSAELRMVNKELE